MKNKTKIAQTLKQIPVVKPKTIKVKTGKQAEKEAAKKIKNGRKK